jgi:hypothetical protein
MIGSQLSLPQTIALPSRFNKEVATMNVDFNTIQSSSRKKGDL